MTIPRIYRFKERGEMGLNLTWVKVDWDGPEFWLGVDFEQERFAVVKPDSKTDSHGNLRPGWAVEIGGMDVPEDEIGIQTDFELAKKMVGIEQEILNEIDMADDFVWLPMALPNPNWVQVGERWLTWVTVRSWYRWTSATDTYLYIMRRSARGFYWWYAAETDDNHMADLGWAITLDDAKGIAEGRIALIVSDDENEEIED